MSTNKHEPHSSPVRLRVEAENAARFNVGTRWEVVASSVESLWQGAHMVTLEEIPADDGEEQAQSK